MEPGRSRREGVDIPVVFAWDNAAAERLGPLHSSRGKQGLAALLIALGAALFGYATARLPATDVPSAFWIGNFSAPWAVLAFIVGWSRKYNGIGGRCRTRTCDILGVNEAL
jgi:hypothetical protein